MSFECSRYHDFSAGHRVVGHENKCAFLHGHNYRVHFYARPNGTLDNVGRVIDFSELKRICNWLEENWDHKMLLWEHDSLLVNINGLAEDYSPEDTLDAHIVWVPFNPTAENMAEYLVRVIAPTMFDNITIYKVTIEETRKCSATYSL